MNIEKLSPDSLLILNGILEETFEDLGMERCDDRIYLDDDGTQERTDRIELGIKRLEQFGIFLGNEEFHGDYKQFDIHEIKVLEKIESSMKWNILMDDILLQEIRKMSEEWNS